MKVKQNIFINKILGNNITNKGVHKLSSILEKDEILNSLSLSDNNIYEQGIKSLSNSLKLNKGIVDLNISSF